MPLENSSKCSINRNIQRLDDGYLSDFIHSVSQDEILTPKQFLLGVPLNNMTGLRKIAQIANRLGHSISYGKVVDIERTYDQNAQKTKGSSEHSILPLKPAPTRDIVMTFFGADNFHKVYH